jgi:hypothetical protein
VHLLPALRLRHGRAVGADGAPLADPDPAALARRFEEAGATWLHVHDADAAQGLPNQWPRLGRLMADSRSRIQFGGGVRTMTQVQQLLDLGVSRVAIGAHAVRNPAWLREAAHIFPDRIVLALDVDGGRLAAEGAADGGDPAGLVSSLSGSRLGAILFAQRQPGPGLGPVLAAAGVLPVQASCPTWSPDALAQLEAAGVAAAVVGPAPPPPPAEMDQAFERHPGPPVRRPMGIVAGDARRSPQGNA